MNWMEQIFHSVWQVSLSATLLITFGWLAIAVLGSRMPAWARHGIWLLVFLRLVMPVVPPTGFSIWNLGRVQGRDVIRKIDPLVRPSPVTFERSAGYQPVIRQRDTLWHKRSAPMISVVWVFGMLMWVGVAVVRHRRMARWVRGQGMCTEERVLAAVELARAAFKVRKPIVTVPDQRFEAPAVFGWRRPVLLLPERWLKEASEEEIHAVLLHEMAHVKCRDAALTWVFILVRSVHWFNPFVWYAFRRLRAERELFCDALVLKQLQMPQRTVYGNTLLKLAAQLSGAIAPPTLVPVLQHKPEIHRRIHMIAKYKSTPWLLSAAFTLLLIVLAGITFTRAADKPAAPAVAAPQPQTKALELLEHEIAKQQEIVRKLQAESGALAEKAETSGSAEALQKLRGQRIDAQAELVRVSSLLTYLKKLSKEDLRRSINTASPDNHLSQLMQQRDAMEQKVAELLEEVATEHPDVKRATRVLAQIEKQIENRIGGILSGLDARLSAEKAHLEALDKAIDEATDRFRISMQHSRPYQESLRELQAQEEILQRLRLRMVQERIDVAIEGERQK